MKGHTLRRGDNAHGHRSASFSETLNKMNQWTVGSIAQAAINSGAE
jgi:hypothetical protein